MSEEKKIQPEERLQRMKTMFSEYAGILAEDYDYFTSPRPPDAPKPPSKAPRKSAKAHEPPALKPN